MIKKLLPFLFLILPTQSFAQPFSAQITRAINQFHLKSAGAPYTCNSVVEGKGYYDLTAHLAYVCDGTNWSQASGATAGASTALDNLASVNINTSLLAQTGVDLGSTTKPFRNLFLFGAGTYATTYLELTGTPTGTRVITLPDATFTVAGLGITNLFTGLNEFSAQTNISGPDAVTNVELGSTSVDADAGTGGTSVAIGNGAVNSGNAAGNIVIGSTASKGAGANSVIIGSAAVGGASASQVVIGAGATANSSSANNVVIGTSATVAGGSGNNVVISGTAGAATTGSSNVVLGSQASAGALSNHFMVGGLTTPISDVYIGKGVTNTSATGTIYHATGGSGNNNAGAGLTFAVGKGTGIAAGGNYTIQRSPSIGSGSTAQTLADALLVVSQAKALTAGSATAFVRVNQAAGSAGITGFSGGTVHYTIYADDATDYQATVGSFNFGVVNKAGTETCAVGTVTNEAAPASSGTLTVTFDTDTSPTNGCDLRANAVSSLTETTLAISYSVILNGPATLTPQ